MSTEHDQVAHQPVTRSEARWPASIAVIGTVLLYVTLPEKLTFGPAWLVPVVEFTLLVPLSVAVPERHHQELKWQRGVSTGLIAVLNAANIFSLALLVNFLLGGGKTDGAQLILSAIQIWLTNVLIFALWYWELDRGGPGRRAHESADGQYVGGDSYPDFLFPQMTTPAIAPSGWYPKFLDYLYLSFTNATAFSPTDCLPLTPWSKMLMLVQSLTSLLTVALVASRAVNILS
jgi:hypothetical protein